jgi:hypothetical protein
MTRIIIKLQYDDIGRYTMLPTAASTLEYDYDDHCNSSSRNHIRSNIKNSRHSHFYITFVNIFDSCDISCITSYVYCC